MNDEPRTYNPIPHHAGNRRRHVNTVADHEICREHSNLVFKSTPLPPILLPNHPDIRRFVGEALFIRLRCCLERIIRDREFKALHCLESAFECFARLDEMAEGLVVVCLDGEGGVVRCWVEEGRFGEVEEDCTS